MEHSKEFYESLARAIEYLIDGNKTLDPKVGKKLTGNYWSAVYDFFRTSKGVYCMIGEIVGLSNKESLLSVLEDCRNHIKSLEKIESDRELSNREKIENITYGRKGYKLSKIAIWLSGLAILVEIIRGIIDLLK